MFRAICLGPGTAAERNQVSDGKFSIHSRAMLDRLGRLTSAETITDVM